MYARFFKYFFTESAWFCVFMKHFFKKVLSNHLYCMELREGYIVCRYVFNSIVVVYTSVETFPLGYVCMS